MYIYTCTHIEKIVHETTQTQPVSLRKKTIKKIAGVSRIMISLTHTYTYTHTRTYTHRYILNPHTFVEAESSHGRSCVYINICLNIHMQIVASNDVKGLVAACCSVLQCLAVCCSVLQCARRIKWCERPCACIHLRAVSPRAHPASHSNPPSPLLQSYMYPR